MTTTSRTATTQYVDTPVDVRILLGALWASLLFVFAYVDIFGFFRADLLEAALDGKVASTPFTVDQTFLTATLFYILPACLMVVLSLVLRPKVNRITNIVVAALYAVTIAASTVGETWTYYLIGSAVEVLILAVVVRTAWTWSASTRPSS